MSRTSKKKNGKQPPKASDQSSDFGNDMLAKRATLKPELSAYRGAVRVRNISDDILTLLFYKDLIDPVQYSGGMAYLGDRWKAGLTGKSAQNMEPSSSGGYYNCIPYNVAPMQRYRAAVAAVVNGLGAEKAFKVLALIAKQEGVELPNKETTGLIRQALDLIVSSYDQAHWKRREDQIQKLKKLSESL